MTGLAPLFGDQFLLSEGERPHPAGFVSRIQGGWRLTAGTALPVTLLHSHRRPVGWLLGWAVTRSGALLHDEAGLAGIEVPDPRSAEFEELVYELAGRWAVVVTSGSPRVHLDPIGSLAAVYDPLERTVASTTTLLRWGDERTFSQERYDARELLPNQGYPAGLTSDPRARRLLPNHSLDLTSWSARRHWAPEPGYVATKDIPDVVASIHDALANVIRTLSRSRRLLLPLTAGRDSRMVMAAARPVLDRCDFVTFRYRDYRRTDATYATAIADRFSLGHVVLSLAEPTQEQKKGYLEAVGYDGNEGKVRDFHLAALRLPLDRGWLSGFAGEIGRGVHLHASAGLTPEKLLRRRSGPVSGAGRAAYSRWLSEVPTHDGERILDLLLVEQGLGCLWVGPHLYGAAPFEFNVVPLNQRRVVEAMIRLPPQYRRAQRLVTDLVRLGWPELEGLPVGRPPGLVGQAQGAARLVRKLRQGHVVRKAWLTVRH